MTGYKKGTFEHRDRHSHKEEEVKRHKFMIISKPRKETQTKFFSYRLRRGQPCWSLNLGLAASRTVRQYTAVV